MTTDQPGAASPPPPNVAALVDAIDARSRQAGADGATEVMQRMLGSVTDVLSGIQDRLDQLEDAVTASSGGGAGGAGLAEAVQAGLASFNARLGRLEEAFVQAVDESGSGTQAVVDDVRSVVVRALEDAAGAGGRDPRLDGLEDRVLAAVQQPAPAVLDRLARVEELLGDVGSLGPVL